MTQDLPANSPRSSTRVRAIQRTAVARAVRAGNTNSLRHGVYSNVAVREEVLDEAALLFARAPWLDEVRDGPLVEATSRLICRLRRLDRIVDERTSSVPLTSLYARTEQQLLRNLDALGLTPRSSAQLGIGLLDVEERTRRLARSRLAAYAPDRP